MSTTVIPGSPRSKLANVFKVGEKHKLEKAALEKSPTRSYAGSNLASPRTGAPKGSPEQHAALIAGVSECKRLEATRAHLAGLMITK